MKIPQLSAKACLSASEGDPEPLRNGVDRTVGSDDNGCTVSPGGWLEYSFERPEKIRRVRLIFDSNLNRALRKKRDNNVLHDKDPAGDFEREMRCYYPIEQETLRVPESMVKSFRVEIRAENNNWKVVFREDNNYQRLVLVPLDVETSAIRIVIETTSGSDKAHFFAFDVR